jgi:MFS family permease
MRPHLDVHARSRTLSAAAACIIAAVALAVAMGIGRFAFTPLLPLMVRDGTLPQSVGAWLAASNYLGYLAGALTASRLGLSLPALMRVSLAGIVMATLAMGAFDGLAVWVVLRFVAGVMSAWTLVATSAWALQHLAQAGRADLSGMVYAGVGFGIAFAGLFCLAAAQPGVPASRIWLELGAIAALAIALPSLLPGRSWCASAPSSGSMPTTSTQERRIGLVICYGLLGFGYILPATFLPALAREVVDDPQVFGLAWPLFGIAAALSTIATARRFGRANRLRVWATSHLLMAIGVVLPSLWLTPVTIAISALVVGSTFMVVTMIGMLEARARSPTNPTALLGLMTTAFAIGQLGGPVFSAVLELLPVGHRAALDHALQLAAFGLTMSAAYLWHQSRPISPARVRDEWRADTLSRQQPCRGLEYCPTPPPTMRPAPPGVSFVRDRTLVELPEWHLSLQCSRSTVRRPSPRHCRDSKREGVPLRRDALTHSIDDASAARRCVHQCG